MAVCLDVSFNHSVHVVHRKNKLVIVGGRVYRAAGVNDE